MLTAFALTLLLAPDPALAASRTLTTTDGTAIKAHIAGDGSQCAVLLHGDQRSGKDWRPFAEYLVEREMRVIVPDLRGHGETGGPLTEASYTEMLQDVDAAVAHLAGAGCTRVALMGAELGAVLALNAAAEDARVTNLVLLSPRLGAHGLKVSSAITAYGDRPMLLIAGESDTSGVRAAGALDGRAGGRHKMELVKGGSAGPMLVDQSAELPGTIVSWLASDGLPMNQAGPRTGALRAGDGGGIETTGTRIGDAE